MEIPAVGRNNHNSRGANMEIPNKILTKEQLLNHEKCKDSHSNFVHLLKEMKGPEDLINPFYGWCRSRGGYCDCTIVWKTLYGGKYEGEIDGLYKEYAAVFSSDMVHTLDKLEEIIEWLNKNELRIARTDGKHEYLQWRCADLSIDLFVLGEEGKDSAIRKIVLREQAIEN